VVILGIFNGNDILAYTIKCNDLSIAAAVGRGTQLIDNQSYIRQILLHFTAGRNTYIIESQGVRWHGVSFSKRNGNNWVICWVYVFNNKI
jgi:hypothetical protein